MTKPNTTQLHPFEGIARNIVHRDLMSHVFRWTYVLHLARIGMNILDAGCGTGNMLELFYRNRYKCNKYLGLEYKITTVKKAQEKFSKVPWAEFQQADHCNPDLPVYEGNWDIIACFEVLEHIGKENTGTFLSNILNHMNDKSTLLISTPNYDEKVGAAQNHIQDGVVQEWDHFELKAMLEQYFHIKKIYGTFASQTHYKAWVMDSPYKEFYEKVHEYYDSNMISVIMAPVIPPEMARNCMWVLQVKP